MVNPSTRLVNLGFGATWVFKPDADSIAIHTMQFKMESLLYIVTWMCIYYTGPGGKERDFSWEKVPTTYGGYT